MNGPALHACRPSEIVTSDGLYTVKRDLYYHGARGGLYQNPVIGLLSDPGPTRVLWGGTLGKSPLPPSAGPGTFNKGAERVEYAEALKITELTHLFRCSASEAVRKTREIV